MTIDIQQAFINNTAPRTIKTYTENEALIGVQPIEEIYLLEKSSYVASSILQWVIPTNSKAIAIHFNEGDDISASTITLGASLPTGTILWTYALAGSDFERKGTTWSWQFPEIIVRKDWIIGLFAPVDIERIAISCKRVAIMDSISPL